MAIDLETQLSVANTICDVRATQLAAMTRWLDQNQPDVWRRGLWDALNAATRPAAAHGDAQ